MRKYIAIFFIFLLSIPIVFADDPFFEDEGPIVKIIYQGLLPIKNAADAKEETEKIMKEQTYPYLISSGKTEITITKYKCDEEMGLCGYWIKATREGREVYTNSPIWISPPPYKVVVSESYDEITNTNTVTIKEDPKTAVEVVLQRYIEMQPLGKAVSYER